MNRRIVIVGFMGCGKTTVAKELACELNCEVVDLDSFITEREHRSPAEIISQDGERRFREIETLALLDALEKTSARVIALGGGTWTVAANRTLIALHDCLSVWLDAPFELCWKRIMSGKTVRPLAPDHDMAGTKYDSRQAGYGLAERRIAVDESDTVDIITKTILNLY